MGEINVKNFQSKPNVAPAIGKMGRENRELQDSPGYRVSLRSV